MTKAIHRPWRGSTAVVSVDRLTSGSRASSTGFSGAAGEGAALGSAVEAEAAAAAGAAAGAGSSLTGAVSTFLEDFFLRKETLHWWSSSKKSEVSKMSLKGGMRKILDTCNQLDPTKTSRRFQLKKSDHFLNTKNCIP